MIICALRLIANNYLFCIYLRHDGVPVERRTHRNAVEDAGTPEHPHDANLYKDYGGKGMPRYGKTVVAYRADGELYLPSDLMYKSKTKY